MSATIQNRQLDHIPREELRAEINRLSNEILDIGEVNSRLYESIRSALEILTEFTTLEDRPTNDAIKILKRALRQKRRATVK